MSELTSIFNRIAKSDDGPNAVEYAVMLSLIIIVCVTAAANSGRTSSNPMGDVASRVKTTR
jgi:pilus assembly protein Flp/PilA